MNTSNRIFNFLSALSFVVIGLSSQAFAGVIEQVKNGKVLIALKGTPAQVGEQFFALNENNKKTAILEVTAVKGDRAVAKITKGTTKLADTILSKGLGAAPEKNSPSESTFIRHDLKKLAVNIKVSTDAISTLQQDSTNPFPNKETVDMKGSNIGLNVTMGIPLGKTLSIQGFAGYEMLKVAGTALRLVCDGKTTTDCNADISYLTVGALGRLTYASNSMEYWAGAGFGFKQPIAKKSTALTLDNISLANTAIIALGLDYHLSNTKFIPVSFEYHKSFNESETVPTISHMGLQVGFGILY
jgi:hypothetical protein